VDEEVAFRLQFRGFDHNDPLEGHMAAYVRHEMRDDRWSELKSHIARNDNGNFHARVLDTYIRMLAEYRRIMDSRKRGFGGTTRGRIPRTAPAPSSHTTGTDPNT